MGYEIKIKYHPQKKDNEFGYDTSTTEEKVIKLGKKNQDIEEKDLALFILKQLSRRDVFVVDAEATILVKKTVKIKHTKDSIVIGTMKYKINEMDPSTFDQTIIEDDKPEIKKPAPVQTKPRIIKREYFGPEQVYSDMLSKRFGLTYGRIYNITKETKDTYVLINDRGQEIRVPLEHFTASNPINELTVTRAQPKLMYEDSYPAEMPILRR